MRSPLRLSSFVRIRSRSLTRTNETSGAVKQDQKSATKCVHEAILSLAKRDFVLSTPAQ